VAGDSLPGSVRKTFALQRILGHESLTMVNKYLAIAQTDLQAAHRDASPVMNWQL